MNDETKDGTGEVLELSVEDTNKLRKELGLAPLRQSNDSNSNTAPKSTDDTTETANDDAVLELSVDETNQLRQSLGLAPLRKSTTTKEPQYVNPAEAVEAQQAKERLESAKLKRTVEQGYQEFDAALGISPADAASSWAQKMLKKGDHSGDVSKSRKKKKAKHSKTDAPATTITAYDSRDLNGLSVAHSLKDFSGDSTTILTLQDASLIDKDKLNEGEVQLESINLAEARKVADGLREKRKVEMGMGRTNGYVGFDDDEFEELGGTQGPSRMARGQAIGGEEKAVKVKGFRIGSTVDDGEEADDTSGANALFGNKAISLETRADSIAADFMTAEEEEKLRQKKKKDKTFKKSKKKKEKKHKKRSRSADDESEDEQKPQSSLLDVLEETAVGVKKKDDDPIQVPSTGSKPASSDKRDRYNAIMAKGNQRARKAFDPIRSTPDTSYLDEEPDDAFLNAALAKARRLKRLQDMQRGAMAVADSLKRHARLPEAAPSADGKVFETDETSEFTRALRARSVQTKRIEAKKNLKDPVGGEETRGVVVEDVEMTDAGDEKVDLHELSKDIKEDALPIGNGKQLGRGVGGVLEMLKGDLSQRHAGKEALRGRSKDERTYDDYAPLNLSEVVKIDERNASKLDKELAHREVKLEYRDKHGRLLTRKEAYRELCYQFHGHGSGKRKEQKKLEQIAREQAEARLAQESATMGALQATQKATGKAYVVHKSGKH